MLAAKRASSGRCPKSTSMPVPQIKKSATNGPCSVSTSARPSTGRAPSPRRTGVEHEIGVLRAAVISVLRKALAQAEDRAHEAPAPGIIELGEVPQEARERDPAIGLDQLRRC